MIEFIESNRGDGQPFFAYVAHQAPGWHKTIEGMRRLEDGG